MLKIKDLREKTAFYKLDGGLIQRILCTVEADGTFYVVFTIESGGFGTLYIERTSRVQPHPSFGEWHTNNLVQISDQEFNWLCKELLERQILDPRWLPMDVAQNYKD